MTALNAMRDSYKRYLEQEENETEPISSPYKDCCVSNTTDS